MMRRFLFAAALVLMLGLIAYAQRPLNATSQGSNQTYNPLVFGPPLPTNTPLPTATATLVPQGTGVFKKDGSTRYLPLDYEHISTCGFIRFWDGSPAYGGSDGFRAEGCLDVTNRCQYYSAPVDATGYYEMPMESYMDLPDSGGGTIYAVQGRDRDRVSRGFRFDFADVDDAALGVTVRIDFIECRVGDDSSQCDIDNAAIINEDGSYLVEVPVTEASPRAPTNACPNP